MQTLDAGNAANKKQIKASIAATIANQVVGSNIEDIARRVEETYEQLLVGATTSEHVPVAYRGPRQTRRVEGMRSRS